VISGTLLMFGYVLLYVRRVGLAERQVIRAALGLPLGRYRRCSLSVPATACASGSSAESGNG
jgi:hypothetical protein